MNYIEKICRSFAIEGSFISAIPYGDGHINSTYLIKTQGKDGVKKYVLQRLHPTAFKNPDGLMNNIAAVTEHIKAKLCGKESQSRALSLIPTVTGKKYFMDDGGFVWRVMNYVADSRSYTRAESTEQIYKSALAFGSFQRMLEDFPTDTLFETIPDFHNTPKRLSSLTDAAENDAFDRLRDAADEYKFAKARKSFCNILEDLKEKGSLPIRVTHNDTKLNNVIFDVHTDNPICVVDLDTVMQGLSVNDFGDFVRSCVSDSDEDERDLSKVNFDIERYELCVRGFLEGVSQSLTDTEIEMLPTAAIMMTLECGIRFLTDYLSGDVYFKTQRPMQNLDRARTQFELVRQMERNFDKMCDIVNKYSQ